MSRSALTRQTNRKSNHTPVLPSQAQSQQYQQATAAYMAAAGYPMMMNSTVPSNVTVTTTVNGVGYPYYYPGMTTPSATPGMETAAMTPEAMMYYAQYAQYYQQQAAALAAAGNVVPDPSQIAAATRGDDEVGHHLLTLLNDLFRAKQKRFYRFMVTPLHIISIPFSTIILWNLIILKLYIN